MRLRRFEGATMAAALARIRADLGPDAVILHTRSLEERTARGGRTGWVEVTAAVDAPAAAGRREAASNDAAADPARPSARSGAARPEPPAADGTGAQLEAMHRILLDLQAGQAPAAGIPAALRGVYRRLCRQEVPTATAKRLVLGLPAPRRTGDRDAADTRLEDSLARAFRVRGLPPTGREPRVVALVGPTGVGKTTTIAKLAGQAQRDAGLRVALMTLDTYRIGAVAQMRIYADLMGAPLHVVRTPGELASAVAAERADLILVDTMGRSPQHREGIQAIHAVLATVPRAEVHLVLSATTKRTNLEDILRRFRPLKFGAVLISKLDEARTLGPILSCVLEHALPVSYLTTGQEVPDDLETAAPRRLARWLLTPFAPEDAHVAARD
jgi:flagellar biosynthesis protein FlhF